MTDCTRLYKTFVIDKRVGCLCYIWDIKKAQLRHTPLGSPQAPYTYEKSRGDRVTYPMMYVIKLNCG